MIRILFFLLVMTLLATGCGKDVADLPNIVLVTVDTLRADRLHCYGYSFPVSPSVDSLAADGILFDSCTSQSSYTIPSLAGMMTGLYPSEVGAVSNRTPLPESVDTLAESLRRQGYETAGFVSNYNLRPDMQFNAGFDHYDAKYNEPERNRPYILTRNAKHTTDAAMGWLIKRSRTEDHPFFIWIHYQDPHGPYTPPSGLVRPATDYPKKQLPVLDNNFDPDGIPKYQVIEAERESAVYRALYDGEVLFFDKHFTRFLDLLKDKGHYERSAIVFTADHGESMGEHGYWFCHGQDLYSELVRVPFIVKAPGVLPGRSDTRISHLDLLPTLMALAGKPSAELPNYRGRNVLDPNLEAGPACPLYTETLREADNEWLRCIIMGDWKLIVPDNPDLMPELYDLAKDPEEKNNCIAANPQMAEKLGQVLAAEKKRAISGLNATQLELTPEEQKNLEALGYSSGK